MLIFKQFEFLSICTKKWRPFFFFFFKEVKKKVFLRVIWWMQRKTLIQTFIRDAFYCALIHITFKSNFNILLHSIFLPFHCNLILILFSCVITYLFEFYSDFVCATCSIHLSSLVRGRMNQNLGRRKQKKIKPT